MSLDSPGKGWKRNLEGRQPPSTKGKRVAVILANGSRAEGQLSPTAPPGWQSDTTRWTITDSPFDVAWWKNLGRP